MHDPMTIAWEIEYPWWRHRPWPKKHRYSEDRKFTWRRMTDEEKRGCESCWNEGYRDTFVTIWHVDPQKDGSDDSCGWSYPKLTKRQKERLRNAAWSEAKTPHFLICKSKEWSGTVGEAECLYRGLVLLVVRVLRLKMSFDQISRYAAEAMHIRTCSKAGDVFCFLPGYHTNFEKDSESHREDHFYSIMCNVARGLLDELRPWWRHPKWHFWHFQFQCHPWQSTRRWLLSRCCKCGGRFKYGESCVTHQWDNPKPKFMRSEVNIMHDKCSGVEVAQEATQQAQSN